MSEYGAAFGLLLQRVPNSLKNFVIHSLLFGNLAECEAFLQDFPWIAQRLGKIPATTGDTCATALIINSQETEDPGSGKTHLHVAGKMPKVLHVELFKATAKKGIKQFVTLQGNKLSVDIDEYFDALLDCSSLGLLRGGPERSEFNLDSRDWAKFYSKHQSSETYIRFENPAKFFLALPLSLPYAIVMGNETSGTPNYQFNPSPSVWKLASAMEGWDISEYAFCSNSWEDLAAVICVKHNNRSWIHAVCWNGHSAKYAATPELIKAIKRIAGDFDFHHTRIIELNSSKY